MPHTPPDEYAFEKIGFDDARETYDREMRARVARGETIDPADLRRLKMTDAVHAETLIWVDKLPHRVQPHDLQVRYPRILNQVYKLWDSAPRCIAYLDDLMRDLRGDRQGFPMKIASELADLRAYREELERGTGGRPWDEVKQAR